MKFCRDCKWLKEGDMCKSPRVRASINVVTGERSPHWNYAENIRDFRFPFDIFLGLCGRRARFFEPVVSFKPK